jgi:hypothetical protein
MYVFVEDLDTFFVCKADPSPDRLNIMKFNSIFSYGCSQAGRIREKYRLRCIHTFNCRGWPHPE